MGKLGGAADDVLHFRGLTWSFTQRELKARFKDTLLGWVWALVVPLTTLAVYAVVFGVIFDAGAPRFGNHREPIYAVWLFCGLVAFGFFAGSVTRGIDALLQAGLMMKKVYFPPYSPVIGSVLAGSFQSLVEMGLVLVVLGAFGNVSWTWLLIPAWAALFFVFTVGVAMACAVAAANLRDVAHLVTVLLQFVFFASPVLYPIEQIPKDALGGHLQPILGANPIGHFVTVFRDLVYGLTPGDPVDWVNMVAATLLAVGVGTIVTERFGRDLAERL